MQHRQTSRRRRPATNNPRPMGQAGGGQSANRMDVRVRGNAHQLLEKYKQMARDSQQAGDRVASEFYLQHADHYFRVLNEGRLRQEEQRARRNGDAGEDYDRGVEDGDDSGERTERAERSRADGERADADSRSRRRRGRPERARDTAAAGAGGADAAAGGAEDAGDGREIEVLELHVSDGEAALAAFGRAAAAEPAAGGAVDAVDATDTAEEAPKPRRRGRPRKNPLPADS